MVNNVELNFWQRCAHSALLLALLLAGQLTVSGCAKRNQSEPSLIDTLQARIESHPDELQPYIQLAETYLQKQDYLRARQYHGLAERVSYLDGTLGPGQEAETRQRLFRLGVLISARGQQYDDAIARCHRWLDYHEDRLAREVLAVLYSATGNVAAAEHQHLFLLRQYPQDRRYLLSLARFYDGLSDAARRASALTYYRRYLTGAPETEETLAVRAHLLEQQMDDSQGEEKAP